MGRNRAIAAMLFVAVLGVACGGGDDGASSSDAADGGSEAGTTVQAVDFAFEPTTVTAPVGGTIELVNEGDTVHSFTVDDAGIDVDADGGESATVDVGDAEPGSYEFYCKYHKDSMTGTLEVTG